MLYVIEYSYDGQRADKSFHFVETEEFFDAEKKAEHFIKVRLEREFGKDVQFSINKVELVKD